MIQIEPVNKGKYSTTHKIFLELTGIDTAGCGKPFNHCE